MTDQEPKAKPVREARSGHVRASVWKNTSETGTYYTVTINNSYKDKKTNEWKESKSYGKEDLADLEVVTRAVREFISLKMSGDGV